MIIDHDSAIPCLTLISKSDLEGFVDEISVWLN